MHPSIRFLFIIAFTFFYRSVSAQSEIEGFYIYEDSSKLLTGQSAFRLYENGGFKQPVNTSINEGFTRSVFWLAFRNENIRPADSLLLFIGHQHINRIHFYYVKDSTATLQWLTGDYYPFSQRPVKATGFYFPVAAKGVYLARIDKSNESLQLSFRLATPVGALREEADSKFILFLFTGMILLLVLFGIYLFLISRDKLYIWYILYISAGWLWVLSNAGLGFEYLWPELPWFASKARPVFAIAPLIFSMLFLESYIGGIRNKVTKKAIRLMNSLLAIFIVFILLFNENGYQSRWWFYIQYLIPLLSLVYIFIILYVLTLASVRGNKLALFYLAAILVLLITGILQVSFSLGTLDHYSGFFSTYGLALGYVAEAVILTAGLVYRFNRYRLDKEQLLLEMNKSQVENTRIMMEVQEAERSQVATQLHDVAGSLLSAARLNLSSLREKGMVINEKAVIHLERSEEAVSMVADMVRNLSHALSPVMLEQVGFKTSLEKVIAIFNASGKIHISLLVIGFEKYRPEYNNYYTALYSIIYELLNNIVKHSGATHALLQVTEHPDLFTLIAEDDGDGFHSIHQTESKSLGIAGIQSKITYLNGSIAFDKNVPQGLIVTIEIPTTHDKI
jgi:two-component system, sensor histidine kinase LadS